MKGFWGVIISCCDLKVVSLMIAPSVGFLVMLMPSVKILGFIISHNLKVVGSVLTPFVKFLGLII